VDEQAIKTLITDLHWQIDQLGPRGVKNSAGNPFVPAQFKRRLEDAIDAGGDAVVEVVRGVVHKAPNQGFKRLEAAGSLDLACEALVADADKPYAHLFSDEDRDAATKRLAPYAEQIAARTAEQRRRMEAARAKLREKGMPQRHELDAQLRRNRISR
jgi:hypothetical protein